MSLSVKNISYKNIIKDISFELNSQDWIMLIGPNGAGKTTIAKALARTIDYTGSITIDEKDIKQYKTKDYAKLIGFQSQMNHLVYEFSVEEVVAFGCYSNGEYDKIDQILELADLTKLRNKSVSTLSGGELQLVFLAQLFIQNPKILVLDEPTNNLDIKHQKELFDILKSWIKDNDVSAISIVHDLNVAKKYGNQILILKDGHFVDDINDAFNINVDAYMKDMNTQWMNS